MNYGWRSDWNRTEVRALNIYLHQEGWKLIRDAHAVDSVLDDCFQLISLFFLTIGRNNEAPAVYADLLSRPFNTENLILHLYIGIR